LEGEGVVFVGEGEGEGPCDSGSFNGSHFWRGPLTMPTVGVGVGAAARSVPVWDADAATENPAAVARRTPPVRRPTPTGRTCAKRMTALPVLFVAAAERLIQYGVAASGAKRPARAGTSTLIDTKLSAMAPLCPLPSRRQADHHAEPDDPALSLGRSVVAVWFPLEQTSTIRLFPARCLPLAGRRSPAIACVADGASVVWAAMFRKSSSLGCEVGGSPACRKTLMAPTIPVQRDPPHSFFHFIHGMHICNRLLTGLS
jgi:hypothetical protein